MTTIDVAYIKQNIADGHYTNAEIDLKDTLRQDRHRFELLMEFYLHLSTALEWNSYEQELFIRMVEKDGNYSSILNKALEYQRLITLIKSC